MSGLAGKASTRHASAPGLDPIRCLIDERVPWAVHGSLFSEQSFGTGPAPGQGWKLHVSATPVSAVQVLAAALEIMLDEGVRFKVVNSMRGLTMLNAGDLGVPQVGKFITVYPSDDREAVRVAIALDKATSGQRGPRVPTDQPLIPDSLVHYRYGAMHQAANADVRGDGADGSYDLLDSAGRLTNDVRLNYYLPPPSGIVDPFDAAGVYVPRPPRKPLLDGRYLVVGSLSTGPRGGVFRAVDVMATPARLCSLKEAWHDLSVDRYGRDARDWLVNEERILVRHQSSPLLPRLYGSFELDGNRYMAVQYIEGTTIENVLAERRKVNDWIALSELVALGRATASLLAQLHQIGLVYRDFSPANTILTQGGGYRLIDFGMAYDLRDPDAGAPLDGGTPPFYSLEQFDHAHPSPADDVFAWGAVLHYACCGDPSPPAAPDEFRDLQPVARNPVAESRDDVPLSIAAVIDRAVAWERADRYATMRDAHDALEQAADGCARAAPRVHRRFQEEVREDPWSRRTQSPYAIGLTPSDARALACEVGDALCIDAEERHGGLCWGARDELRGRTTYTPDLYTGAAGIALFLAELSQATGTRRYEEAAREAARWLAGPAWGRGRAQHGLHGGEPGIAFLFVRLADLLNEPGYVTAAELRMRRLDGVPSDTVDLLHGTAGTILALLSLHGATGDASYLASAAIAGDELARAAVGASLGRKGCYWEVASATRGEAGGGPYLGLLHGAAGIGLALARLARATGEDRYLDVARGAGELLLTEARSAQSALSNGDSDAIALTWPRRLGDDEPGLQAHCHGAGGIGQFFLLLDGLTPDLRYRDAAKGAACTLVAQSAHESRSCLCHGLVGTGHLLLDCYQAFDDARWLPLAGGCVQQLQRFRDPERAGVYGIRRNGPASPDLMVGYAGVGSLLMRLIDAKATPELILGRAGALP